MKIEIQHNAADRSFFVQDAISDNEYRDYVQSFAVACVEAVRAAYPDAEIVSEVDWSEVSSDSKYVSASSDDVAENVEQIVQRVWDKQSFCGLRG